MPFCFVLNPALLFKGDPLTVIVSIAAAFVGIPAAAAALQGYVLGIGAIPPTVSGAAVRILLIAGGLLLSIPTLILTFATSLAAGVAIIALGLVLLYALLGGTIGRKSS